MSSIRGTQNSSNFGGAGKRNFYYAPQGQSNAGDAASSSAPIDMSTILLRQPFSPAEIKIVNITPPGMGQDTDTHRGS
jgi:hypothetical protein